MDEYLSNFVAFTKEKLGDDLAGILIYGSYTKGYFDPEASDYDVFVLFANEPIDIQEELAEKFPKVSLQVYMSLDQLKEKIVSGGWNTYIAFVYTAETLYATPEMAALREKMQNFKPNVAGLSEEQKKSLIEKLKGDSKNAEIRDGFVLNKFIHSSLLRKLQILHYLRGGEIVIEFNDLLKELPDQFIEDNRDWLEQVEATVFSRSEELVSSKENYIKVLDQADLALQKQLGL